MSTSESAPETSAPAKYKEHTASDPPAAPFATVLGITNGGVEVFSCDYDSITDRSLLGNRAAFETFLNGVSTGFKYQCVELARRYLIINHGVTFESIPMAYDIFDLKSVKVEH